MRPNNLVRNIHIGNIITNVILEKNLKLNDVCLKMGYSIRTINKLLNSSSMDTIMLLKWSKVLKYDFFRLYSSHLMLHHGISNSVSKKKENVHIEGIYIRKNVYTSELISFLVSKVRNKEMTPMEVVKQFGIPKTTYYKWLQKSPK